MHIRPLHALFVGECPKQKIIKWNTCPRQDDASKMSLDKIYRAFHRNLLGAEHFHSIEKQEIAR